MGVPQNGWFIMENPIKMDYGNLQIDLVETNGTVCSPSALGPALWPKDELLRFYDWFQTAG